jgi:hypothetical protein
LIERITVTTAGEKEERPVSDLPVAEMLSRVRAAVEETRPTAQCENQEEEEPPGQQVTSPRIVLKRSR